MGTFSLVNPWLLLALAGLPVLWWWLRALPPPPQSVAFPAISLIQNRQAPVAQSRPPFWLILLRLLLAAVLILAASAPVWRSDNKSIKNNRLVIVVDNGWESASSISLLPDRTRASLQNIAGENGAVAVLSTAEPSGGWPKAPKLRWLAADVAETRLAEMRAEPWSNDRDGFIQSYAPTLAAANAKILWLSDGTNPASAQRFADALTPRHAVEASKLSEAGPIAFRTVVSRTDGFVVELVSTPQSGARSLQLIARQGDGKIGGTAQAILPAGAASVRTTVAVAPADRVKVTRLEIAGQSSAAATYLLDDSNARPLVGIYSGETVEQRQPLRSGSYYIRRALETHADVREGSIDALMDVPVNMMILTDVGAFPPATQKRVKAWLENGGLLLSFAGPRMAESGSPFAPVPLRPASRTMGGALTWGTPVKLAPFPAGSPFAGINIDPKVSVSRQVLAEPSADLTGLSWASLADKTPLITAAQRGAGLSVLVHTTSGPDWTDLPLSGMFEQMLRQLLPLAGRTASISGATTGSYILDTALLGDGSIAAPGRLTPPIAQQQFDGARASPATPPGLYRSGDRVKALNLANPNGPIGPRDLIEPLVKWPDGVTDHQERQTIHQLAPLLWKIALLLLVGDALGTLLVRRKLPEIRFSRAITATVLLILMLPVSSHAAAAPAGALEVRLGYVTGTLAAPVDSQRAFMSLNDALTIRTAIRPGPPQGVIPGRDALGFYTLIYWPVSASAQPLDGPAAAAVARYLEVGGILIVDTAYAGPTPLARAEAARRMLSSLSLPRLEQLGESHVLAKSFYLLGQGPARSLMSQVWVEADTRGGDGRISGLIIGSQNLARTLVDTTVDSPSREGALRLGINAVMYALTGTYKADQVHAESLLERMQSDGIKIRRVEP